MIKLAPVSIEHYLILSAIIFVIGLCSSFFKRKNIINVLMSIELMLIAINLNFVAFASVKNDVTGHVFVILIFAVAAAEVAVALAILIAYYRKRGSIRIEDISEMKG